MQKNDLLFLFITWVFEISLITSLYLQRKPVQDSDSKYLCLRECKVISVFAKIATMHSGKPVPRADRFELSNDTKGGQNYYENVEKE